MERQKIDTLIGNEWVPDWSIPQALRELLQNALDVGADPSRITWWRGTAFIRDTGPGIDPADFVLGRHVSKTGDLTMGQFGAGLKQALAVLTREGKKVEILSNGLRITTEFADSDFARIPTLHLLIEPGESVDGTVIKVPCEKWQLDLAKEYFEAFQQIDYLGTSGISRPGGMIWVNGTMVGMIDKLLFSYHFTGDEARKVVDQDRKRIDTSLVTPLISVALAKTDSQIVRETYLKALLAGEDWYETNISVLVDYHFYEDWQNELARIAPGLAISSYPAADVEAGYKGYKVVHPSWAAKQLFLQLGVPTTDKAISGQSRQGAVVDLMDEEKRMLKEACDLISHYWIWFADPIVVEDLGLSDGNVTFPALGMYSNGQIYLDRKVFRDKGQLIETIIHELAHKYSNASDLTAEFEHALGRIAANIIARADEERKVHGY